MWYLKGYGLNGRSSLPDEMGNGASACRLLSCWFVARLILRSWRWMWHVTLKRQLDFKWRTWRYNPEDGTFQDHAQASWRQNLVWMAGERCNSSLTWAAMFPTVHCEAWDTEGLVHAESRPQRPDRRPLNNRWASDNKRDHAKCHL
jgi:hypothetical protein